MTQGGSLGWRLLVYDRRGNRLPYTAAAQDRRTRSAGRSRGIRLRPGSSRVKEFHIRRYCAVPRSGTFYVYACRAVTAVRGGGGPPPQPSSAYVRSPIYRLTLRKGQPPTWKVVRALPVPRPPAPPKRPVVPPFPKYKMPASGPIVTLAEVSEAVHAGDLSRVKRLCYSGGPGKAPYFVAMAQDAISIARFCRALQKKFGINPQRRLTQTHTTPKSFSQFLAEIDAPALKINGDRAAVPVLWYDKGKFVRFPKFDIRFRKVHGRWLLDSWASYKPISPPWQYRMDVENELTESHMYGALTRALDKKHFANLKAFEAYANPKAAAQDNWFMRQWMKDGKKAEKADAARLHGKHVGHGH